MYLSKLEIQGFKSFASGTALDFQRGITAIVGPNGSGKSNVADAIRWVLGEQSLKLLRGKKSEDVIFAGSDKKARLGVAEVALFLNNEDRRAPIDYSELVITRRVYRDGTGEYLINHREARLQDIQLLLAQANFGQRTYSVIGQGMIDGFLISSPQERKHLFDEAAGVRQYQLKKGQAVNKLAVAKENLIQGQAIMTEIEPRLRSLTRQVRRLEKRELVAKELRAKQLLYFGLRWQEVDAELAELRQEYDQVNGQRETVVKEQYAIQTELDQLERERSASEVFAGLQHQYNRILDQKNQRLEQQSMLKGRIEAVAKQAGAGETAWLIKRATEVKSNLESLMDLRANLAEQIKKQSQAFTAEQRSLDEVQREFQAIESKLNQMHTRLSQELTRPKAAAQLKNFLHRYEQFVAGLESAAGLDRARSTAVALQKELTAIVAQLEAAGQEQNLEMSTGLQQSLLQLASRRQARLEKAMRLQTELRLAENQDEQLKDQADKLQSEYDRLNKEADLENLAKTNPAAAQAAYNRELKNLEIGVAGLDAALKAAREKIQNFNDLETSKKERLFALQKEFRNTQHQLNLVTNQVNERQVKIARAEQRLEDMKREISQAIIPEAVQEVAAEATKKLAGDVALLAEEIGYRRKQLELIGGIDEQTTNEYRATNERWEFLKKQSDDLEAAIAELEEAVAELDGIIKQRFDAAFKKINQEFNTYFRSLFRGGRAELVLVKEIIRVDDDLTEAEAAEAQTESVEPAPATGQKVLTGIDIKATPPGKRLQSIAMLSGGERALTSIALLCAIISNNPSPFVVLDEVDAALDEANSQRFAAILEQLAKRTQFVVITHNRATMEKSHTLYGVTMGDDGVSQLLSVKMEQAEEIIRKHGNR